MTYDWPELDLISNKVGMALPLRWWPRHFSLKKLQELWILPYATLRWSGKDDASHILHAVLLLQTANPFKIIAKSNLVRRLDNLDPTRRKWLCEENFCWRFLVHVLLRVRHRFHLNLLSIVIQLNRDLLEKTQLYSVHAWIILRSSKTAIYKTSNVAASKSTSRDDLVSFSREKALRYMLNRVSGQPHLWVVMIVVAFV